MTRIDKYLWVIRVFKTRSEAAEACKSGKVKVNEVESKASKEISVGDRITVRKNNIIYSYTVQKITDNRLPAKLVEEYVTNETSQSELDKLNRPIESIYMYRERGSGRPTKKDRREIDRLFEEDL